jgi:UDP-glucose 4-epimerase
MTTWLLTGGAGYIGAHVLRELAASGRDVVVLDDLSTGVRAKVPDGVPLVEASVLDAERVASALRDHHVDGIVHLAAKKAVGESVERPSWYWHQNVEGLRLLLDAATTAGVSAFVFSSSAAVYGEVDPDLAVVTEEAPTVPVSPYGATKLAGEWLVRHVGAASGLRHTSLRYFNVAGAGSDDLGDTGVHNLIPMVFRRLSDGQAPQIFGDDYPTSDGTCVRDYIHVQDLAEAHVAAVVALEAGTAVTDAVNISTGRGYSVAEVVETVLDVTGHHLDPVVTERRPGDPPRIVGSTARATDQLGWTATRDLADMVTSAWSAWQASRSA